MRRVLLDASDGNSLNISTLLGSRIPLVSLIQALAVSEHLSFRHAANVLGVSQSSVSTRVKLLEDDLGVMLFERHARGVRLTQAGKQFVDRVRTGICQLDHAIKSAGMQADGSEGEVRIGVHALLPGGFLDNLLSLYRKKYPGVQMEISEGVTQHALTQLRSGNVDIVFTPGHPNVPDLHSQNLWTERLMVAAPLGSILADKTGVSWSDLADQTFLVRVGGTGPQIYHHIISRLSDYWPRPSVVQQDVERGTLMSMVGQGFGITIVGEAASLVETPSVVFLPIIDEPEPASFSAIWSPHDRSSTLKNLLGLARKMSRSARRDQ